MSEAKSKLIEQVRACTACEDLPLGPRPVIQVHPDARILIVGQAPGLKVHRSGIPWDDASGVRLREWLGVTPEQFYDSKLFAILPVAFCYPGRTESGDAPPAKKCFDLWHGPLRSYLKNIELTLLVGRYAQTRYLENTPYTNGTEIIKHWKEFLPEFLPLPHPSPRNNIWLSKNPWFTAEVVPKVQKLVARKLKA